MTIEDDIKRIQELIKTIENDTSIHPAKRKAVARHLENAKVSLMKNEEDYIKEEKIAAIARKLMIIFVPMFMIFLIAYDYGIPNYVSRGTNIFFFISISSFAIAFASPAIAPKLYWIQHNIFKPKSA